MYIYTIIMKTKVTKWGNSLGIRIPQELAKDFNLTAGSVLSISRSEAGTIHLIPAEDKGSKLKKLLSQITPENLHEEIVLGEPAGNEAW